MEEALKGTDFSKPDQINFDMPVLCQSYLSYESDTVVVETHRTLVAYCFPWKEICGFYDNDNKYFLEEFREQFDISKNSVITIETYNMGVFNVKANFVQFYKCYLKYIEYECKCNNTESIP